MNITITDIFNYATLIICILSTCYLSSILIILIKKRNTYKPLKTCNIRLSSIIIIFGIIHLWATFIANDHMLYLSIIQRKSCVFFIWWLQYGLGILPWITCFVLKIIEYAFVFDPYLNTMSYRSEIMIKLLIIFIITEPVILLCIVISVEGGCYYDTKLGYCVSTYIFKLLFAIWSTISAFSLALLLIFIRFRKISSVYYNQSKNLGQVLILVVIAIIINSIITFFGFLTEDWGRALFTCIVALMHVFSDTKFLFKMIIKAINNDQSYVKSYNIHLDGLRPISYDKNYIRQYEEYKSDFLDFCKSKSTVEVIYYHASLIGIGSSPIDIPTSFLLNCYNDIQTHKKCYNVAKSERITIITEDQIIKTYLSRIHAEKYIYYTLNGNDYKKQEFYHTNCLDNVLKWILDTLIENFGDEYINHAAFKRPNGPRPSITHKGNKEVVKRLILRGLSSDDQSSQNETMYDQIPLENEDLDINTFKYANTNDLMHRDQELDTINQ